MNGQILELEDWLMNDILAEMLLWMNEMSIVGLSETSMDWYN